MCVLPGESDKGDDACQKRMHRATSRNFESVLAGLSCTASCATPAGKNASPSSHQQHTNSCASLQHLIMPETSTMQVHMMLGTEVVTEDNGEDRTSMSCWPSQEPARVTISGWVRT